MPTAFFDTAQHFTCERELRKAFMCESLYLETDSSVTMYGEIETGNNVSFSGNCEISNGCTIGMGNVLKDVKLGPFSQVKPYCFIADMVCGENNIIGPYCYIRENTKIGKQCIIGAHLEVTRTVIGNRVKISHQGFVGDGKIDDDVILGSGTVFCNWNGEKRNEIHIGNRTTVGSGTMIIAPCRIGSDVILGAGSIISKDVPKNAKIIQKRF